MTTFNVRVGSATDVGRLRKINQDAIVTEGGIYGVADGMGGHQGGEVASAVAAGVLNEGMSSPTPGGFEAAVKAANLAVYEQGQARDDLAGMGTTVVAIAEVDVDDEPHLVIVNVGDSRGYLLRDRNLVQITEDHSLVADLVRAGRITAEEAENHPRRNIVTRVLGLDDNVRVDQFAVLPFEGDRFLMCSDGLTNEVSEAEITATLRRIEDPDDAAAELVRMANESGGRDNISIVIVDVLDDAGQSVLASAAIAEDPSGLSARDDLADLADEDATDDDAEETAATVAVDDPDPGVPVTDDLTDDVDAAADADDSPVETATGDDDDALAALGALGAPAAAATLSSSAAGAKIAGAMKASEAAAAAQDSTPDPPIEGDQPPEVEDHDTADDFVDTEPEDAADEAELADQVETDGSLDTEADADADADADTDQTLTDDVEADEAAALDSDADAEDPDEKLSRREQKKRRKAEADSATPDDDATDESDGDADTDQPLTEDDEADEANADATDADADPDEKLSRRELKKRRKAAAAAATDSADASDEDDDGPSEVTSSGMPTSLVKKVVTADDDETPEALSDDRDGLGDLAGFDRALDDSQLAGADEKIDIADDDFIPTRRAFSWRVAVFLFAFFAVVGIAIGALAVYARGTYYVGFDDNRVAVFQGRPGGVLFFDPTVEAHSNIVRSELLPVSSVQVDDKPEFGSFDEAEVFVTNVQLVTLDKVPVVGEPGSFSDSISPSVTTTTTPAGDDPSGDPPDDEAPLPSEAPAPAGAPSTTTPG